MERRIRICAIIPVRDGLASWGDVHRALLAPIASPRVEITLVDLPEAPVGAIKNSYTSELVALQHVEAAIQAQRDGYDAVAMGCLGEPGVEAAKEALDIPVIGEAQAVMHYASMVGRRFSFLMPGSKSGRRSDGRARRYEDIAARYGFAHKLASVRSVIAGSLDFASQENRLRDEMLEQGLLAVEEDGADAVIGYGGLEILERLRGGLPVPVVDPIQASAMMAESLVRLRLSQSEHAYPKADIAKGRASGEASADDGGAPRATQPA